MKLIKWIDASAGTGKTSYILNSINELINSGINPNSILCLSFTKKTASEMYVRYQHGNENSPAFSTIHSFANSIIKVKKTIITDDKIFTEIVKEAIEMTLNSTWTSFFQCLEAYDFSNIVDDLKTIIQNRQNILDESILVNIANLNVEINNRINLSETAKQHLTEAKLNNLKNNILSNDLSIYLNSLITKDLQINKTLLPESFIKNPMYKNSVREIQNVLKNILSTSINSQNNYYTKQSALFNIFLNQVYNNYIKIKESHKLFDYNDLITDFDNIDVEKLIPIQHIFIDEAQDLSALQWSFLYNIFHEVMQHDNFSICIVGDEKQIIYEFQGATPKIYESIKQQLMDLCVQDKTIKWHQKQLNKSYRIPNEMISFINQLMNQTKYLTNESSANNNTSHIKTWLPIKSNEVISNFTNKWKITTENNIPQNIQLCINEIQKLINTKLLNQNRYATYSDIMIIIPKRSILTFILFTELEKAGIPIKESPFYIDQDDIMAEFIMIGDFILNQTNDIAVVSILKGLFFQWTNEEIEELCCNRSGNVWDQLSTYQSPRATYAYQKILEWLTFPQDILGFFGSLFFNSQYGKQMQEVAKNEVLIFWEKVIEFSSSSLSLFAFIQSINHSSSTFVKNIDGITMCTIHAAKGRESEIVLLFNSNSNTMQISANNITYKDIILLKGNYPLYHQAKNKLLFEQEMQLHRLLYVSITRAKEQLIIIPPMNSENIIKSIYYKVLENINLFQANENGEYEILNTSRQSNIKIQR